MCVACALSCMLVIRAGFGMLVVVLWLVVECGLLFVCWIDYFGGPFLFTVVWFFCWWFGVKFSD